MADAKISAGANPTTLVATDKVPVARSASTTAYAATLAQVATYTNSALAYETAAPAMDGVASAGSAATTSRGNHVHPTDTSRAPLISPDLTGAPTAPTVTPSTDSSTKIATTAFVQSALGAIGGGGSGAATFVGDTPPGSPTAGQLWWESDSGLLFIYYTDANSSQWVPATVGTQGPPGSGGGGSFTRPVTTANSGTSQALTFAATSGDKAYDITLTGNCVFTVSGGTAGQAQEIWLVVHGGAGGFTATLPGPSSTPPVYWPGGVVPTLDTSAGARNELYWRTVDGGTTISGNY